MTARRDIRFRAEHLHPDRPDDRASGEGRVAYDSEAAGVPCRPSHRALHPFLRMPGAAPRRALCCSRPWPSAPMSTPPSPARRLQPADACGRSRAHAGLGQRPRSTIVYPTPRSTAVSLEDVGSPRRTQAHGGGARDAGAVRCRAGGGTLPGWPAMPREPGRPVPGADDCVCRGQSDPVGQNPCSTAWPGSPPGAAASKAAPASRRRSHDAGRCRRAREPDSPGTDDETALVAAARGSTTAPHSTASSGLHRAPAARRWSAAWSAIPTTPTTWCRKRCCAPGRGIADYPRRQLASAPGCAPSARGRRWTTCAASAALAPAQPGRLRQRMRARSEGARRLPSAQALHVRRGSSLRGARAHRLLLHLRRPLAARRRTRPRLVLRRRHGTVTNKRGRGRAGRLPGHLPRPPEARARHGR